MTDGLPRRRRTPAAATLTLSLLVAISTASRGSAQDEPELHGLEVAHARLVLLPERAPLPGERIGPPIGSPPAALPGPDAAPRPPQAPRARRAAPPTLSPCDLVALAGGFYHTLALRQDGRVLAWGSNGLGQLGDGTRRDSALPVEVSRASGLGDAAAVAAGYYHSCALARDETVWCWGFNALGQLGDGSFADSSVPVRVLALDSVVALAAGLYHTLALRRDGSLWAWGNNNDGQLGIGSTASQPAPVPVPLAGIAVGAAAGGYHSLAQLADGSLVAMGNNSFGQFGDATTLSSTLPAALPHAGVSALAAGELHSLLLLADGTLRAMGDNSSGQLGDGTRTRRTSPVAVLGLDGVAELAQGAPGHALARRADGSVWAWGRNDAGQLGDGSTTGSSLARAVAGIAAATRIAGGGAHSAAIVAGAALGWGSNLFGQMGTGAAMRSTLPVRTRNLDGIASAAGGGGHSLFARRDGAASAAGRNHLGQLGDATLLDSPVPVDVASLSGVVGQAAGTDHSLHALADGSVWSHGAGSSGQLGLGSFTSSAFPVRVPGIDTAVAVSAGASHSLALLADGTLLAWGLNTSGQLGDGTTITRSSPVAAAISGVAALAQGGASHSCALKLDGTVWCWGANSSGQLGDGTLTARRTPVQVAGLGGAVAVGLGSSHSCAVLGDGSAWCWGRNSSGQLGDGTFSSRRSPVRVAGLAPAARIAAGASHTLALFRDGRVAAWGSNGDGQLGDGSGAGRPLPGDVPGIAGATAIAAGPSHSLAIASGEGWGFGLDTFGALGALGGATFRRPVAAGLPACAGNLPPVATAGGPYLGGCREARVDLARAEDPEGEELSFTWSSDDPRVTLDPPGGTLPAAPGPRALPGVVASLAGATPCGLAATLTLEVVDAAGNRATAAATVTFRDERSPTLDGVPGDADVACDAVPPPAPVVAQDDCDPAPRLEAGEKREPGACADDYTLTRTWLAEDHCGNPAAAQQTIRVSDRAAPVLTGLPGNLRAECDAVPPPPSPGAADGCDPAPSIAFDERRSDGDCPGRYRLERTWRARDRCGNESAHTATVEVVDTTPPGVAGSSADLRCLWPPNHRWVCFARSAFAPALSDACSPPVTWRFAGCASSEPADAIGDGSTGPDCEVRDAGERFCVRAERSGTGPGRRYSVLVSATDACGNASPATRIGYILVPHDPSRAPSCPR